MNPLRQLQLARLVWQQNDAPGGGPPAPAPPSPEPTPEWTDGQPFDPDRAKALIVKQREEVRTLTQAVKLASVHGQAARAALGLGDDATPAQVTAAINRARLAGALEAKYADHRVNAPLARELLKHDPALAALDPNDPELDGKLDELMQGLAGRFKEVRQAPSTQVAGIDLSRSGEGQSPISRETLAQMLPEEVALARRTGRLAHLGIPGN